MAWPHTGAPLMCVEGWRTLVAQWPNLLRTSAASFWSVWDWACLRFWCSFLLLCLQVSRWWLKHLGSCYLFRDLDGVHGSWLQLDLALLLEAFEDWKICVSLRSLGCVWVSLLAVVLAMTKLLVFVDVNLREDTQLGLHASEGDSWNHRGR